MKDIPIHDYMKARWIDFYHKIILGMTQIFSFFVPVFTSEKLIGDINLSLAEEKWLEEEVVKKRFKRFIHSCLVLCYMASRMRKKDRSDPCPYDWFIHVHCPMPTNAPTSVNTRILNLGLENMLIEGYTS